MYHLSMETGRGEIRLDRVEGAIEKRDLNSKKLARMTGISEAAISKLLSGKTPGMSAVYLARIAKELKVSVDYLMGFTDDPLPKGLTKEHLIIELVQISQDLTNRRRRDLIATARAYLESEKELKGNPKLLVSNLVDLVSEAGGEDSRRLLLDILQSDIWSDSDGTSALDDGDDPVDDEE